MNIQTILPICYIYMLFSTIKLCHYTDYPFIRHILFPPTVGDSMEPMLRNRKDTIIIEPVHGRLKRYDLPLYRRPDGKYVLHRILQHRFHAVSNRCGDTSLPRSKFFFQRCITHKFIASYASFLS